MRAPRHRGRGTNSGPDFCIFACQERQAFVRHWPALHVDDGKRARAHQASCAESAGIPGIHLKAPGAEMENLGAAGSRDRGILDFIFPMRLWRLLFL